MTPKTYPVREFVYAANPSNTFNIDTKNKTIQGMIDGLDAVKQSVYLIFQTERFAYPIFSWNYGIETKKLIGKPMSLAIAESERYIKEALMQDDRINSVTDFYFEIEGKKLKVSATVETIFGSFPVDKEVSF